MLLYLPLLALAAPVLLTLRSHFGIRFALVLAAACWLPLFLVPIADGLLRGFLGLPSHISALPEALHVWRAVHIDLMAPAVLLACAHLPLVLWRWLGPPEQRVDPGDTGSVIGAPAHWLTIVADLLRLGMIATAALNLWPTMSRWGDAQWAIAGIELIAAGIVASLALRNGNVLPALAGRFLGLGGRIVSLWRYTTRLAFSARTSKETLAAVFSRRSPDLKAIIAGKSRQR